MPDELSSEALGLSSSPCKLNRQRDPPSNSPESVGVLPLTPQPQVEPRQTKETRTRTAVYVVMRQSATGGSVVRSVPCYRGKLRLDALPVAAHCNRIRPACSVPVVLTYSQYKPRASSDNFTSAALYRPPPVSNSVRCRSSGVSDFHLFQISTAASRVLFLTQIHSSQSAVLPAEQRDRIRGLAWHRLSVRHQANISFRRTHRMS